MTDIKKVIGKIMGDKHSKANAPNTCTDCGGKLLKVGYNKLREEETLHCTGCGKKYKYSRLG